MRLVRLLAVAMMLFVCAALLAQQKESGEAPQSAEKAPQGTEKSAKSKDEGEKEKAPPPKEEPPVVTHHEIHVGGRVLRYTATAGYMPIHNDESGDIEANIFFMAYTLDNSPAKRALMFSFNGGPGSASIWLHLGAIGPKRVKMLPGGEMPQPPFELVDNEDTWLDQTDLVFIDPVGTGYSRAVKKDLGKKFFA